MADRQEFSFTPGDLGIVSTSGVSTEDLIQAGESFLNSEPDDIKFIQKPQAKKKEEVEDDEEEEGKEKKVKKVKEVVIEKKEVSADDVLNSLEEKTKEKENSEEVNDHEDDQKQEGEEKKEGEEEANTYAVIAEEMLNQGIFLLDEDEEELDITTPEALRDRFLRDSRKHASNTIEKFLSRFGEEYQEMFENVFVKGINPLDYLNRYAKIESVKGIDISTEDNQERVVRQLLRAEGRSAEYIEKRITQLKNYNDLQDEATEAQKILVQREEAGIAQEAAQKEADIKRKAEIKNEYRNSVIRILNEKIKSKEFDGIPVDKRFGEQIFSYITEDKFQTKEGQVLTTFDKDILDLNRPENHELKVKIAMLLQIAKEDPKLTKLANKAVSKETSELFKGLKKSAMKTASTPNTKQTQEEEKTKSWF